MEVRDVHWLRLAPVFVHPYRAYARLHATFGDTIAARLPGGGRLIVTIDDRWIEHVLVGAATSFIRPPELVESIFVPTVGMEVVASNGEAWVGKRQRAEGHLDRGAWAANGFAALEASVEEFVASVRALAGRGVVDLLPAIEDFVLAAAVRLVCGREPGGDGWRDFAHAMAYVMRATQELGDVRKRAFLYSAIPRAREWLDGKRLAEVDRAVAVIAKFEPDAGKRELLLATYENPSTTLTWALQFLATSGDAQARLREEARAFARYDDESLFELVYTEAALRESARLRPAIAYLVREAIEPTTLDGIAIERGTSIAIVPYLVHQDARRWPSPTTYDPARFLTDIAPRRFLAFGVGPRACVGTRFAMRILKAGLAKLATAVRWTSPPNHVMPSPSGRFPWSEKVPCPVVLELA